MNLSVNMPSSRGKKSTVAGASRVLFFLYVFFVLLGTSKPYREQVISVEDIITSNPINQVVYSIIPFMSFLCLLPKGNKLILLLKKEKYLTLFLIWGLLSVFWSNFPFISFKRWVRVFGSVVVSLSVLLHLNSTDEVLDYLKAIIMFYIPISFLAILFFIPEAIQWEFPAWRGLTAHKNQLGQVSLVSIIIWSSAINTSPPRKRVLPFLFLGLSLILLFGSRSTTSLLVFIFLLLTAALLSVAERLHISYVDGLFSMIFCLTMLLFLAPNLTPDALESTIEFFRKDSTFTGRIDLWTTIFEEVRAHPLLGCGFDGFWIVGNPPLMALYEDFRWFPNQAHEGYLDILNETGIVGLFLFILMVIFYFKNLLRLRGAHFWKWLLICSLLLNLQESTLFRSDTLSGFLFTFSYLALYAELTQVRYDFPYKIHSLLLVQFLFLFWFSFFWPLQ